ncbi:hypothetical protein GOBAR_DD09491 [Gossypium barbadense]|nr:hypothetical protein GOBAR_DD09491 [Gossypium barbadense]
MESPGARRALFSDGTRIDGAHKPSTGLRLAWWNGQRRVILELENIDIVNMLTSSSKVGEHNLGQEARLISAAFGENEFFCAIDAGGEQQIICWDKTNKISSVSTFDFVPFMASLSGGEGFLCGITANNSQAFCWDSLDFGMVLVVGLLRKLKH